MKEEFSGLIRQKIELGEGKSASVESRGKDIFVSLLVKGKEKALWRLDVAESKNEKGEENFSLSVEDLFKK